MALSGMSGREKTVVAILAVVILAALIGIGILVARLVTGDNRDASEPILTVAATTPAEATATSAAGGSTQATITPVPVSSQQDSVAPTAQPVSQQRVVVVTESSPSPILPVMLTNFSLPVGRIYRLEISAADGSNVVVQGSWAQAATGTDGTVGTPLPEFFDGPVPISIDVVAPVVDPVSWTVSVSAAPQDLFTDPPILVVTLYDVTGAP